MDGTISDPDDGPFSSLPNTQDIQDSQVSALSAGLGFVSKDSTAPASLPLPGALRLLETFSMHEQEILSRLYSRVPPQYQEAFVATAMTRLRISVLSPLVMAWEQQSETSATGHF